MKQVGYSIVVSLAGTAEALIGRKQQMQSCGREAILVHINNLIQYTDVRCEFYR